MYESLHASQVRGAVEPKICESCGKNFMRDVGSSHRVCKPCRVPFAEPETHTEFDLEVRANGKKPYLIH